MLYRVRQRKVFRKINGIICIALGIFLFVPGLIKPDELFVPLVVGAFATIFGISAVIPRKSNAEKYLKKARKLAKAINSSIEPEDTVVFGDDGIFENGTLLMKYEEKCLYLKISEAKYHIINTNFQVPG